MEDYILYRKMHTLSDEVSKNPKTKGKTIIRLLQEFESSGIYRYNHNNPARVTD